MTIKRISASLIFLPVLILGFSPFLDAGQNFSMKKDITVAADDVQDNIFAFGGNVVIEGRVKQTVFVLGGSLTINGEVGESVVGIGSRLVLKPTAVVKGDLVCIGGSLEKEPGCRVMRDTVYFKSSEISGRFMKGIFAFPVFVPFLIVLKLINVFLWLIIALVVAAIFPKQIARASDTVRRSFWPVFGTGLLSLIIFSGLVIFAVLLSFILIGIPVLITLVWAGIVIKLFGRIVMYFFFGESLLRSLGAKKITAIGASLLGLLLVSLVGFIPFVGILVGFVLNILGWGVVLRTKFGTTEHWIGKK